MSPQTISLVSQSYAGVQPMGLTALRPELQPGGWVTKGGTLIQTRVDGVVFCPINLVWEDP